MEMHRQIRARPHRDMHAARTRLSNWTRVATSKIDSYREYTTRVTDLERRGGEGGDAAALDAVGEARTAMLGGLVEQLAALVVQVRGLLRWPSLAEKSSLSLSPSLHTSFAANVALIRHQFEHLATSYARQHDPSLDDDGLHHVLTLEDLVAEHPGGLQTHPLGTPSEAVREAVIMGGRLAGTCSILVSSHHTIYGIAPRTLTCACMRSADNVSGHRMSTDTG
ncbi:hypothetical protein B0J12DRAFT_355200 [Macrophomina phaseolina]|uniref:Uncharacterized protein n=1 Tax=Macrophomina phaseolina TaxID=35725 RepID=A0ABQ8FXA0_9PEZI|nr:hypothetical protein B0J12DRAFT_355200 [Macrophomina phaseolina]